MQFHRKFDGRLTGEVGEYLVVLLDGKVTLGTPVALLKALNDTLMTE